METIQQLVIRELESNPYILDLLQNQLANVSAVAEKLQPILEDKLGKSVKLTSISMAIRRYTESLDSYEILKWEFPKELEISTRSDIYEVAIERTLEINKELLKVSEKLNLKKGNFLSIVEGTYETVIFTNQKNKAEIKKVIKNCKVTSELDNLSYVTVNWEKLTKDIPGIYFRLARALAFKRISIQSFHTIGAEMMLLFKEDVFLEAYKTISKLLDNESSLSL